MDLELLLKKEKLNEDIHNLECLKIYKNELKRLKNELISIDKQIRLQCQKEGHCFGNKWTYYEDEIMFGNTKLIKCIYEKKCDVCGVVQKTKKLKFTKEK